MKPLIRLLLTWHEWREAVHDAEMKIGFSSSQFRYHKALRDYHEEAADRLIRESFNLPREKPWRGLAQ